MTGWICFISSIIIIRLFFFQICLIICLDKVYKWFFNDNLTPYESMNRKTSYNSKTFYHKLTFYIFFNFKNWSFDSLIKNKEKWAEICNDLEKDKKNEEFIRKRNKRIN